MARSRRHLLAPMIAVVASGILAGTTSPGEAQEAPARAVTVVRVARTCFVDALQVTGVVVPRYEVVVRPDREGLRVSDVLVQPGDTVIAGQVLARLKPPDGSKEGGNATITAPVAGTVYAVSTTIGAIVSVNGEPLFRIAR